MNRKTLLGTALMVMITLMLVGPTVTAQSVKTDASATKGIPVSPLLPEIDTAGITLGFIYTFPNQAFTAAGLSQSTASASLDLKCNDPTNIVITGPRSTSLTLTPAAGAPATDKAFAFGPLVVSVTRELPGLKQTECTYSATVSEISGGVSTPAAAAAATGGEGSFTVSAKFYSVIQAKVAQQIKQAGPQKEVPFEIALDNFGNARTQISFEINERPGGSKWQAIVPDDLILDSPASGGAKTSDTAIFSVTTPYKNGWNNEQGTFRLKMKTFAADDPNQEGVELFTNVLVRVRGVYVPSLEPFVMVGAVLGSALVARRKLQ